MTSPDPSLAAGTAAIARAYGLGEIRSTRYLESGVLNRNWRLDTAHGRYALKELDALAPDEARRSLGLLPVLAAAGVPVAEAVPSPSGEAVVQIGGHHYYLTAWIDGTHPRGAEMDRDRSFHLGTVLGRVHRALADPATGLAVPARPELKVTTFAAARERIGHHLGRIAVREEPDAFDRAVEPMLRERPELLAAHEHRRPSEDDSPEPFGWIHGDCQNWNLLWRGDRIAAVIDWDRLRVNPYGEEIVRAAMYQFALPDGSVDSGNVAALVAGYRTEAAIGPLALAVAARHRWRRLLTSVWHLKHHYDRGDGASDGLFFADERLLRWWTAHLDEVEAAFAA
ncbi:phosphotransferase [Glycomyces sp. NRRL B-16210]|uniref:phosphotransferase n=1 Tax=Glycomyces sp. NRRL B-16210 TaxID=1463821 RepID=UPI000557A3FD|nr:phosphotransferase [Glycomyces sp. NRRL B-16210]